MVSVIGLLLSVAGLLLSHIKNRSDQREEFNRYQKVISDIEKSSTRVDFSSLTAVVSVLSGPYSPLPEDMIKDHLTLDLKLANLNQTNANPDILSQWSEEPLFEDLVAELRCGQYSSVTKSGGRYLLTRRYNENNKTEFIFDSFTGDLSALAYEQDWQNIAIEPHLTWRQNGVDDWEPSKSEAAVYLDDMLFAKSSLRTKLSEKEFDQDIVQLESGKYFMASQLDIEKTSDVKTFLSHAALPEIMPKTNFSESRGDISTVYSNIQLTMSRINSSHSQSFLGTPYPWKYYSKIASNSRVLKDSHKEGMVVHFLPVFVSVDLYLRNKKIGTTWGMMVIGTHKSIAIGLTSESAQRMGIVKFMPCIIDGSKQVSPDAMPSIRLWE